MHLEDWLAPRLSGAPPELASAVRDLLHDARRGAGDVLGGETSAAAGIADRLVAAALFGFDEIVADSGPDHRSRGAALRLLAADAALTYAFEAAADLDQDVGRLADRLGPRGALGDRLLAAPGRRS